MELLLPSQNVEINQAYVCYFVDNKDVKNIVSLTLWRPLLPYGYSYKASCARLGYAVICNFWHLGTL